MLYDMIEVFVQPILGNGTFVGNDLQHNEKDNGLVGKMYDAYGHSEIKGTLDLSKGLMGFNKQYHDRETTIKYTFKKQDHIWVGEFKGEDAGFGEVMCEIFEVGRTPKWDWNDIAKNAQLSIDGTEKWSKNIVDGMIKKGYLEIVKNSATGKDVVKPLERP
ncbi:hypothetical protein GOV13_01595 [Candidatus Pacearchaeota archaeon]|nr:hypothetical protein [Candidatus Pacearchaeota archaeon]